MRIASNAPSPSSLHERLFGASMRKVIALVRAVALVNLLSPASPNAITAMAPLAQYSSAASADNVCSVWRLTRRDVLHVKPRLARCASRLASIRLKSRVGPSTRRARRCSAPSPAKRAVSNACVKRMRGHSFAALRFISGAMPAPDNKHRSVRSTSGEARKRPRLRNVRHASRQRERVEPVSAGKRCDLAYHAAAVLPRRRHELRAAGST